MKNKIIKSILIIVVIVVGLLAFTGCTKTANSVEVKTTTNNTTEHKECEHDWVITSKYSFWADSYKTISKCSKCGKTIE